VCAKIYDSLTLGVSAPVIHLTEGVGWVPEPVWTRVVNRRDSSQPGIEPRS